MSGCIPCILSLGLNAVAYSGTPKLEDLKYISLKLEKDYTVGYI